MVVLEHGAIVVEECEAGGGVDVEVVGRAAVVKVVDDGRHQAREDLQVREPTLLQKETRRFGHFDGLQLNVGVLRKGHLPLNVHIFFRLTILQFPR